MLIIHSLADTVYMHKEMTYTILAMIFHTLLSIILSLGGQSDVARETDCIILKAKTKLFNTS